MVDLHGSSANTENLLRICSEPANRLKETMQSGSLVIPARVHLQQRQTVTHGKNNYNANTVPSNAVEAT